MNLCNEDHDEVCYEGHKCPCCELRKELESTIASLESDVSKLEDEVTELNDQLAERGEA